MWAEPARHPEVDACVLGLHVLFLAPLACTAEVPKETKPLQIENTASLKKRQEKHSLVLITNFKWMHEIYLCHQVLSVHLKGVGNDLEKQT